MPTKWAPPSVVRMIEVHTGFGQGAVPSSQNSSVETAVKDSASKPSGTGPPVGGVGVVTGWTGTDVTGAEVPDGRGPGTEERATVLDVVVVAARCDEQAAVVNAATTRITTVFRLNAFTLISRLDAPFRWRRPVRRCRRSVVGGRRGRWRGRSGHVGAQGREGAHDG
jgi:hypothetical protein